MSVKKFIQKVAEEVRQDKNDKNYKYSTFQGLEDEYIDIPGLGRTLVSSKVRESFVNVYEKSYLDESMEHTYNLPVGGVTFGAIETRYVETYHLPDNRKGAAEGATRPINTYSCVVFGDTTSATWENTVRQEMKSKGHIVIDAPVATKTEVKETAGVDKTNGVS